MSMRGSEYTKAVNGISAEDARIAVDVVEMLNGRFENCSPEVALERTMDVLMAAMMLRCGSAYVFKYLRHLESPDDIHYLARWYPLAKLQPHHYFIMDSDA